VLLRQPADGGLGVIPLEQEGNVARPDEDGVPVEDGRRNV
jgi:hypothetical protein